MITKNIWMLYKALTTDWFHFMSMTNCSEVFFGLRNGKKNWRISSSMNSNHRPLAESTVISSSCIIKWETMILPSWATLRSMISSKRLGLRNSWFHKYIHSLDKNSQLRWPLKDPLSCYNQKLTRSARAMPPLSYRLLFSKQKLMKSMKTQNKEFAKSKKISKRTSTKNGLEMLWLHMKIFYWESGKEVDITNFMMHFNRKLRNHDKVEIKTRRGKRMRVLLLGQENSSKLITMRSVKTLVWSDMPIKIDNIVWSINNYQNYLSFSIST